MAGSTTRLESKHNLTLSFFVSTTLLLSYYQAWHTNTKLNNNSFGIFTQTFPNQCEQRLSLYYSKPSRSQLLLSHLSLLASPPPSLRRAMASLMTSTPHSMTVIAAMVQPSKLNAVRVSMVSGLRMPQKIQLKATTKRSSTSCFRTKCSVALPETLGIVQSTIAKQLSIDASTVTPQTKFADLGADSLDTVEIMMALEEKFGVSVGEGGAENISTVQEAADLIEKVKAEAA